MSTEQAIVIAVGVAGLIWVFSSGAKLGRKAERGAREVAHASSVAVHALIATGVIVGVQWAVLRFTTDVTAWAVTLGVPALFAGAAVARLFTVTTVHHGGSRRGGRR
jgi:hypothetical protein